MTIIADTRPAFRDGLTLGGADLTLLLEYLRTADRRLRLGHRTAGIVTGLKLRAETDVLGQTAYALTPGIAIDGFGRMILSQDTVPIDPVELAGLPAGSVPVWIGYSEAPRSGLRKGFEVCDEDAFARVDEGFDLFFGRLDTVDQRRDGLQVDGTRLNDAREIERALGNPARPTVCDASVPFQDFPNAEDRLRWLLPLGNVGWDGATLVALDPALNQPQTARAARDLSGVVAETIYASEGLIRLSRRETRAPAPGETVDAVCAATRAQGSDFAVDPLDPAAYVPEELVWVEGHLRALGDLRLWGTGLVFRNPDGSDTSSAGQIVPLEARRGEGDGLTPQTQDIHLTLGTAAQTDAENRLVLGRQEDDGSHLPVAALTGLGKLGLGTADPGRYLATANALVIEGDAEAGQTIRASGACAIHFAQSDAVAAQTRGRIRYDHGNGGFSFATGGIDHMWLDAAGRLGIGVEEPGNASAAADDVVVLREGSAGISVICGADAGDAEANGWSGRLAFGRGLDGGTSEAGAITYSHGQDRMQLRTDGNIRVTIDRQGEMGIGTTTPRTRLHVTGGSALDDLGRNAGTVTIGTNGDEHLKLGETGMQALRAEGAADQLQLQPLGGGLRLHGLGAAQTRAVITEDGEMGLGTTAPADRLEVHGRVRLGGTGDQFALAGRAGDLVIRGTVDGDGDIRASGGGFTSVRTQTGRYTVMFVAGTFAVPPTVLLTVEDGLGSSDNLINLTAVRADGFDVRILDLTELVATGGGSGNPGASVDESAGFHFIAIGSSSLLTP